MNPNLKQRKRLTTAILGRALGSIRMTMTRKRLPLPTITLRTTPVQALVSMLMSMTRRQRLTPTITLRPTPVRALVSILMSMTRRRLLHPTITLPATILVRALVSTLTSVTKMPLRPTIHTLPKTLAQVLASSSMRATRRTTRARSWTMVLLSISGFPTTSRKKPVLSSMITPTTFLQRLAIIRKWTRGLALAFARTTPRRAKRRKKKCIITVVGRIRSTHLDLASQTGPKFILLCAR
mmetsp:Transcript_15770/g.37292  ORF Transcript_15770/g.37292 Transcript_15770/m.37292 type:complete len:238 (+) Transcript_15770:205-918(+)